MEKDSDKLYLLGGKANPTQKLLYTVSTDKWEVDGTLPFNLVNGACAVAWLRGRRIMYSSSKLNSLLFLPAASLPVYN